MTGWVLLVVHDIRLAAALVDELATGVSYWRRRNLC